MVRIYYQTLVTLYLSYLYVKYMVGVDQAMRELAKRASAIRGTGMSNETFDVLIKLIELSNSGKNINLDELNSLINNRPEPGEDNSGDINLIDTLAQLVQAPFLTNRMPYNFLTTLRRALCEPIKLKELNQNLQQAELHCFRCEHVFLPNEMVTFVQDPYNKKDVALLCHRCRLPEVVGCDHCGSAVDIQNSYLAKRLARKRWYCERHANPEGRAENVPATPTGVPDVQTTARNPFTYNGGAAWDTILIPPPPPPPNPIDRQFRGRWPDYAGLNLPVTLDIETT